MSLVKNLYCKNDVKIDIILKGKYYLLNYQIKNIQNKYEKYFLLNIINIRKTKKERYELFFSTNYVILDEFPPEIARHLTQDILDKYESYLVMNALTA